MWFLPELIAYLDDVLAVPVFTTVPEHRPERCVSVVYSASRSDRFIERPSIMFHCWAESDLAAMGLAYELADALFDFPAHSENVGFSEQRSMYAAYDGSPLWNVTFAFVTNR